MAAFMPGASPPDVTNPIVFKIIAPTVQVLIARLENKCDVTHDVTAKDF